MILIVEDERVSRMALEHLLRLNGYEATGVGSTEEAETLVQRGVIPEVALVDVDLPGRNGMDLVDWLKVHAPTVKSIFVTGSAPEAIRQFQQGHDCDYVPKPIDFLLLLRAIQRMYLGRALHN